MPGDPRYRALLVGNGRFERDPHALPALSGPAADVELLRSALTHPERGLFPPDRVQTLVDATHSEVLEALEGFFNDAGPEDLVLFYYSGHGYMDTQGNFFLCARNTRTDRLGSTAIPDANVNLVAAGSRARKYVFVLDCCHSGAFKGAPSTLQLGQGSGRCLISSCASHELSRDAGGDSPASPFTRCLSEALLSGQADADGDGDVLLGELFRNLRPRVYEVSKQTVQWTMHPTFGDAVIARAPARRPSPQPPPQAPEQEARPVERPVLEVSETRVDPPEITAGESLPPERIEVFNSGGGRLDWTVQNDAPWIQVEADATGCTLRFDTSEPGQRRANLVIRDRGMGGSRTVRVLLRIAPAARPRLGLSPSQLDFGNCPMGSSPVAEVRVSNLGSGTLEWELHPPPAPLSVTREGDTLRVSLSGASLGSLKTCLHIGGNGGEAELPVRATFTPPLPPDPHEEQRRREAEQRAFEALPIVQAFLGWWTNDNGALRIRAERGVLAYIDYNAFGVVVGSGQIELRGATGWVSGVNQTAGPYTGQLAPQGQFLMGTLHLPTMAVPVSFLRQPPWFAAMVG